MTTDTDTSSALQAIDRMRTEANGRRQKRTLDLRVIGRAAIKLAERNSDTWDWEIAQEIDDRYVSRSYPARATIALAVRIDGATYIGIAVVNAANRVLPKSGWGSLTGLDTKGTKDSKKEALIREWIKREDVIAVSEDDFDAMLDTY